MTFEVESSLDVAELPVVVLTQSKMKISAANPRGASTRLPDTDDFFVADT